MGQKEENRTNASKCGQASSEPGAASSSSRSATNARWRSSQTCEVNRGKHVHGEARLESLDAPPDWWGGSVKI